MRHTSRSDRANVFGFRLPGLAILSAVVGHDETKALVLIEKLNCARRHDYPRETRGVAPLADLIGRLVFPNHSSSIAQASTVGPGLSGAGICIFV